MVNLSYLIYPVSTLEENSSAQTRDRQKKLAADIIARVSENIKIRNAQGFKSIKVAYSKDYLRGGKALYASNDRSSPLVNVHMGLLRFDNIVVEEEDREAIIAILDRVFTVEFPPKGYTVTPSTVYDRRFYTVVQQGEGDTVSNIEVHEDFVPVTSYEIEWTRTD